LKSATQATSNGNVGKYGFGVYSAILSSTLVACKFVRGGQNLPELGSKRPKHFEQNWKGQLL
jgi:hypothetical protein